MGDRVKQIFARGKEFFAKMSGRVKILLLAAVVLTLALIIGLVIFRSTRPYAVLFTGLSSDDMSSILTYLNENNVSDYRIQNNDTILVREGQEARLKAGIIQQGYPSSGYGYKRYLDNINSLSSDSDREQLSLYDLQDRLGAVIRYFDGVKDAQVFITKGEDRRYILSDDVIEAKASVIVTPQSSQGLSDQTVTAIRNAVSHAVPNLQIDNVDIEDTEGNKYSGGGISASMTDSAQLKMSLESQVNNNVRTQVMAVLIPLFGADNVSVSVNSTVDVSRKYEDSTVYELPDWAADGSTGGKGIIGTWIWDSSLVRGDEAPAGGVVGTSTNSDLNEYVIERGDINGNEQQVATSGEIDYDNTRHQYQVETQGGVITDVMVSVVINSAAVNVPNTGSLVQLVARAAGIGAEVEADKIAILAYPFYQAPAEPETPIQAVTGLPGWAIYVLLACIVLFLILLTMLLLVRRRGNKKRAELQRAEAAAAAALAAARAEGEAPPEQGANIMNMRTDKTMELLKTIRQFAEDNPAIAAQMLKNWLRGGDENA